ncbi:MAG: hypothetical protein WDZ52_05665 [Pseudohongiellaceae bacterium]
MVDGLIRDGLHHYAKPITLIGIKLSGFRLEFIRQPLVADHPACPVDNGYLAGSGE